MRYECVRKVVRDECIPYGPLNHSLTISRHSGRMIEHPRLTLTGATYFFTVRLEQRGSSLLTDHIAALRFAYAKAVAEFPVTCHAMVVLPDHLHAIWTEPVGDVWYAERWRRIKTRFAQSVAVAEPEGRPVALWQKRFDEYPIRSEDDYRRAMEYCRVNPVRHGLVASADLWPWSSFNKVRGDLPATAPVEVRRAMA